MSLKFDFLDYNDILIYLYHFILLVELNCSWGAGPTIWNTQCYIL